MSGRIVGVYTVGVPVTDQDRRLRVFLVDDHAMFRAGVRAELGAHVDVIGDAGTVADAISRIAATGPDAPWPDARTRAGWACAPAQPGAARTATSTATRTSFDTDPPREPHHRTPGHRA